MTFNAAGPAPACWFFIILLTVQQISTSVASYIYFEPNQNYLNFLFNFLPPSPFPFGHRARCDFINNKRRAAKVGGSEETQTKSRDRRYFFLLFLFLGLLQKPGNESREEDEYVLREEKKGKTFSSSPHLTLSAFSFIVLTIPNIECLSALRKLSLSYFYFDIFALIPARCVSPFSRSLSVAAIRRTSVDDSLTFILLCWSNSIR